MMRYISSGIGSIYLGNSVEITNEDNKCNYSRRYTHSPFRYYDCRFSKTAKSEDKKIAYGRKSI